jgi:hypothetical protein
MVACCASPTDPANPPREAPPVKRSVYTDCLEEANRFKWIQSEKAGYDLGEAAIGEWVREHWNGYLRARWLEHLQGACFWVELDRGDYGLLQSAFRDRQPLLDHILGRLKCGMENLDVIRWACAEKIEIAPVLEILEALDVNSRRLCHQFSP